MLVLSPEQSGKRLGLLREAMPRVAVVAALWNPADRLSSAEFKEAETAARALGVQLHPLEVRTEANLEPAFTAATRARAGP